MKNSKLYALTLMSFVLIIIFLASCEKEKINEEVDEEVIEEIEEDNLEQNVFFQFD